MASVALGVGIAIDEAEEGEAGHAEETLRGIELKSTPLVLAGLVASLVLALAVWRYGQRGGLLGLAAIFCLGCAVLDGIEASRKLGDQPTHRRARHRGDGAPCRSGDNGRPTGAQRRSRSQDRRLPNPGLTNPVGHRLSE